MLKIFYKYIVAFSVIAIIGFFLFNYLFLPIYVMNGNDHYLPDLRGEYLQKAKQTVLDLGFKSEISFAEY